MRRVGKAWNQVCCQCGSAGRYDCLCFQVVNESVLLDVLSNISQLHQSLDPSLPSSTDADSCGWDTALLVSAVRLERCCGKITWDQDSMWTGVWFLHLANIHRHVVGCMSEQHRPCNYSIAYVRVLCHRQKLKSWQQVPQDPGLPGNSSQNTLCVYLYFSRTYPSLL